MTPQVFGEEESSGKAALTRVPFSPLAPGNPGKPMEPWGSKERGRAQDTAGTALE